MKPYIYSILFFISIQIAFSQTKEIILDKSYKVDENTILNLDLDNVAIVFEESFDNKIHFNYTMILGRYSKRQKENIRNQSKISLNKENDLINLEVRKSVFLGTQYIFEIDKHDVVFFGYDNLYKKREDLDIYKSREVILKEIDSNAFKNFKNKIDYNYVKRKKIVIKEFVIKIPKNVKIRLKSLRSNLTFRYNLDGKIVCNSIKGTLKFKKINSTGNQFDITKSVFKAEEINGGNYDINDVNTSLIGFIKNAKLNTETSKIEIGEIGENVVVEDFNSNFKFYNFNKSFNQFQFQGDYSKLFFYNVKNSDYKLITYGKNTIVNLEGNKTTFGDSKKEELIKILEKKPKTEPFSTINIQLKNGILNIK